jgi:hypothetical protein
MGKVQMQFGPQRLGFDGEKIWVGHDSGSFLMIFRASDGKSIGTANSGSWPVGGMAFDGENMWVTDDGSYAVNRVSGKNGSFGRTIPVGVQPAGVIFDGTAIWVANQGDDTVTKIIK